MLLTNQDPLDLVGKVQESLTQFRRAVLRDMKTLLQDALQEALDKHATLAENQEQRLNVVVEQMQKAAQVAQNAAESGQSQAFATGAPRRIISAQEVTPEKNVSSPDAVTQQSSWAQEWTSPQAISNVAEDPVFSSYWYEKSYTQGRRNTTFIPTREAVIERVNVKNIENMLSPRGSTRRRGSMCGDVKEEPKSAAGSAKVVKLFGNIKSWLRQSDSTYNVFDLYYRTGIMQAIAKGNMFNNITFLVIAVNAVYMGVEADWNTDVGADSLWEFQLCDNLFCCFFLSELMIRFAAFEVKKDCLVDGWFKFDSVLVMLMIGETWMTSLLSSMLSASAKDSFLKNSALFRLFRLLRLARISRLMRSMPELVTMLKGMMVATRAVGSAILMLVLLVYVFAIVLYTLNKDRDELDGLFDNIRVSMQTLLTQGVLLDDVTGVVRALASAEATMSLIVFVIFVGLTATTVMNMLIGVLCEVVCEVANAEKEEFARAQIKASLQVMLISHDKDGSGDISKDELEMVLLDPESVKVLDSLHIDIPHLLDITDMLYENEDTVLRIPTIMELILHLRGERPTTMQDIAASTNYLRWTVATEVEALGLWLREDIATAFSAADVGRGKPISDDELANAGTVSSMAKSWLGFR
jgi:hypothetical protein